MPALLIRMSIPPRAGVGGVARGLHASEISDIDGDRVHLALPGQLGARGIEHRLVPIPQRDRRPGGEQPFGDRPADALPATGHHRTLALEIDAIHRCSSLVPDDGTIIGKWLRKSTGSTCPVIETGGEHALLYCA